MSEPQRFGLSAALVSPFDERGGPDLARLVGHARAVLAEGCDSITLFGTTGEGFSIPLRERAAMLGAVAGAGISLDKVYAGVSATTVAEAAEQAELALSAGVRGLLVAPPFYLKGVDDEGLYGWFRDFLGRLGGEARGVILYHIPGQTAVPLSSSLVRRLRDAFGGVIAGIKDSSGTGRRRSASSPTTATSPSSSATSACWRARCATAPRAASAASPTSPRRCCGPSSTRAATTAASMRSSKPS